MRATLALALFAFAATATVAVAAPDDKDNKCIVATKGDSPTAKACAAGGRKEATKVMKQMVKTAKAKGTKFVCDDCHADMETYKLKDNAKADYEKLVAAQK